MSVIDGVDVLKQSRYISVVMGRRLDSLLQGKETRIPPGVLNDAQKLFSVGMDFVRKIYGREMINQESWGEIYMTYTLLIDMIIRAKGGRINTTADSELESLAKEFQLLTPDGSRVNQNREKYLVLRDVFGEIYKESTKYDFELGHSPYSIGTFDDGDDD